MVASGNFSLTAAMCQAAALLAARHLPQWEVIDYASATKPDVPSGTARELAERLGEVRAPALGRPIEELHGPREARGAGVGGTQRPLGPPAELRRLDRGGLRPARRAPDDPPRRGRSAEPYVAGTLMAVRRAPGLVGLTRGLDTLLLGAG